LGINPTLDQINSTSTIRQDQVTSLRTTGRTLIRFWVILDDFSGGGRLADIRFDLKATNPVSQKRCIWPDAS
jgi:hypothetical protein